LNFFEENLILALTKYSPFLASKIKLFFLLVNDSEKNIFGIFILRQEVFSCLLEAFFQARNFVGSKSIHKTFFLYEFIMKEKNA